METRRSSKRKDRDADSGQQQSQQSSRKSARLVTQQTAAEPPAKGSEAPAHVQEKSSAAGARSAVDASAGPTTRSRATRGSTSQAATQSAPVPAVRGKRTRGTQDSSGAARETEGKQRSGGAGADEPRAQAAAQAVDLPPARPPAAEAGSRGQREMANRQSRLPDDDDRDLADMFGRNFSGPGSALQGLLRKLGAMEDMMPGGMLGGMMSGGRLKAILQGLRSPDDEAAQLTALSELNELLSISSEDNLAGFPVESVVPLLVQSLNAEHSPDVMLLAARALTFLADVLPPSCASIVRHGAVPAFCARLLTIEYIDLAEQSLQALEKLSHEHAPSLLQNGGLLAVLSYLDFFPTGVQRTAVATAANLCRSLTQSPSVAASGSVQSAVREAIPMLTGLLSYQDAKVVDSACQSLSYIAEASAAQPALLEALTGGGLVGQATQLIGLSDSGAMTSQLSVSTYYGLLKLLATAAASSASVATTLMNSGAVSTARTLLATSPLLSNTGTGTLLRTPDHLHEVLGLLVQLLPPAPDVAALVTTGGAVALGGAETITL